MNRYNLFSMKFFFLITYLFFYSNILIAEVKIIKNNDFQTLVQLNNKDNINVDDIPRNSWVKMIIEVQAIWINKKHPNVIRTLAAARCTWSADSQSSTSQNVS